MLHPICERRIAIAPLPFISLVYFNGKIVRDATALLIFHTQRLAQWSLGLGWNAQALLRYP